LITLKPPIKAVELWKLRDTNEDADLLIDMFG